MKKTNGKACEIHHLIGIRVLFIQNKFAGKYVINKIDENNMAEALKVVDLFFFVYV